MSPEGMGPEQNFSPIRMLQVEIGAAIPDISAAHAKQGQVYTRAWALIRLHVSRLTTTDLIRVRSPSSDSG